MVKGKRDTENIGYCPVMKEDCLWDKLDRSQGLPDAWVQRDRCIFSDYNRDCKLLVMVEMAQMLLEPLNMEVKEWRGNVPIRYTIPVSIISEGKEARDGECSECGKPAPRYDGHYIGDASGYRVMCEECIKVWRRESHGDK